MHILDACVVSQLIMIAVFLSGNMIKDWLNGFVWPDTLVNISRWTEFLRNNVSFVRRRWRFVAPDILDAPVFEKVNPLQVFRQLVVGELGQEDDVLFVDQQFPGTWIGERNFESVTASDGQNEFPVFSDSQPGIPEPAFDAEKYIKSSTRFL